MKITESTIVEWISGGMDSSRYVVMTHVPEETGFNGGRTCDLIVADTWPSGTGVSGYEIKCSRGDWLRELRDPVKSDAFANIVDSWYLAVPEAKVIRPGELPEKWGFVVATAKGVRVLKRAARRKDRKSFPYGFTLAMLRRAGARAVEMNKDISAKVREKVDEELEARMKSRASSLSREHAKLTESVAEFEKKSGLKIDDYNGGSLGEDVAYARLLDPSNWRSIPGRLNRLAASMQEASTEFRAEAEALTKKPKSL